MTRYNGFIELRNIARSRLPSFATVIENSGLHGYSFNAFTEATSIARLNCVFSVFFSYAYQHYCGVTDRTKVLFLMN